MVQQTWGVFSTISMSCSFLILLRIPSQSNLVDAEGHREGIRSQGCSELGRVWNPACQAQHSRAAQLPPMWGCRGGSLDNLTLSHQQIDHKLISSWISMVTIDTSILASERYKHFNICPYNCNPVFMATLTNAHSTLQICNMPFLAGVTCTRCTYSLEEQWFVIWCILLYQVLWCN